MSLLQLYLCLSVIQNRTFMLLSFSLSMADDTKKKHRNYELIMAIIVMTK